MQVGPAINQEDLNAEKYLTVITKADKIMVVVVIGSFKEHMNVLLIFVAI